MEKSRIKKEQYIMLLLAFLFWFGLSTYLPYQTAYLVDIGTEASVIGFVLGAFGVTQLLLRIPIGVYGDMGGKHKQIIQIGLGMVGISCLIRIGIPNAMGFFIANLLAGVGASTWISFMVKYPLLFEKNEMQVATGKLVGVSNGGALFAFVLGMVCYNKLGMSFLNIVSVCAAIIGIILASFLKPIHKMENEEVVKEGVTYYLKGCWCKGLIIFSMVALVQQGILGATVTNFTIMQLNTLGVDNIGIGVSSVIYMIAAVFFAFLASTSWCIKKEGRFWIPTTLILLMGYCICVPFTTQPIQVYGLQIVIATSQGILFTFATSEAMRMVDEKFRSTAMGMHQAIMAVGATFIPMSVGKVMTAINYTTSYFLMAAICLLMFITILIYYIKYYE